MLLFSCCHSVVQAELAEELSSMEASLKLLESQLASRDFQAATLAADLASARFKWGTSPGGSYANGAASYSAHRLGMPTHITGTGRGDIAADSIISTGNMSDADSILDKPREEQPAAAHQIDAASAACGDTKMTTSSAFGPGGEACAFCLWSHACLKLQAPR